MYLSSGRVTVVKTQGCGTEVCIYEDELEAVLMMIDNGTLARANTSGYGSEAHLEALRLVEEHIAVIRQAVAEEDT